MTDSYAIKRLWTLAREGHSRFLKGDMKRLSYFKEKARRSKLQFEVIIVQLGGSKAALSTNILKLLGTTELFLKTTTQGDFRVREVLKYKERSDNVN